MSKKSRRKKQHAVSEVQPTKFFFTFSVVQMLKASLQAMEEAFDRITIPLPNLEFGRQVLEGLKQKINGMLEGEDYEKDTSFDSNEMYILHAAVHLYLIELMMDNDQELIATCLQLCEQFDRVVDAIPPKP